MALLGHCTGCPSTGTALLGHPEASGPVFPAPALPHPPQGPGQPRTPLHAALLLARRCPPPAPSCSAFPSVLSSPGPAPPAPGPFPDHRKLQAGGPHPHSSCRTRCCSACSEAWEGGPGSGPSLGTPPHSTSRLHSTEGQNEAQAWRDPASPPCSKASLGFCCLCCQGGTTGSQGLSLGSHSSIPSPEPTQAQCSDHEDRINSICQLWVPFIYVSSKTHIIPKLKTRKLAQKGKVTYRRSHSRKTSRSGFKPHNRKATMSWSPRHCPVSP